MGEAGGMESESKGGVNPNAQNNHRIQTRPTNQCTVRGSHGPNNHGYSGQQHRFWQKDKPSRRDPSSEDYFQYASGAQGSLRRIYESLG